MHYEKPNLTIDVVLLTLIAGRLHVALKLRESDEPASEKAKWEVTGGFVHTNEDPNDEAAAKRILRAKLDFEPNYLEQSFTEANDHRDPRGWSASIVYLALHEPTGLQALVAARGMQLVDAEDNGSHLPAGMAFDHKLLVTRAVEKLRAKARYSTLVAHFLPKQFLLSDFHEAFQAVRGTVVNPANFRAKILKENVLVEMEERLFSKGRPGTGYYLNQPLAYFDRVIA
jgi:ADP-ribose pyrophosphatase YjhB (NUDIX family)